MEDNDSIFAWLLGLGSVALGGLAILYATGLPQATLGFYAIALFMAMVIRVSQVKR